jgi:hypothetical protein
MKKITTFITLFVLGLTVSGSFATSVSAATYPCSPTVVYPGWEGCEPGIGLGGTISTDKYSAIVTATYNSNGSNYNDFSQYTPTMSIEYGLSGTNSYNKSVTVCKDNQSANNNGQTVTALCKQNKGSRTSVFYIDGLTEGKKYQYRARLDWVGGTKYSTEIKEFTAVKAIMPADTPATTTSTTPTTSTTTNTTTSTNTPVVASTVPKSGGIFGIFGTTTTTTKPTTTSRFSNVDEKSGLKLAIDNGETQVNQGDTVTIKVRYENNSEKSYSDGVIDIYLPDQYSFDASNKGIYDKVDHVVSISLRDFPAGGFGTAVVSVKATGKAGDLDQAVSQASLKVGGVSLKVTDIDEYVGGSGSVLGASASRGAGFLPASLIGWIVLLIVLAGIVIIGRRYFVKKDY